MDYRYEFKEEAKKFHNERKAFIIIDDEIKCVDKGLSHWEYCSARNISKEVFETLVRGFIYGENMVFYKNNFTYDDQTIEFGLKYVKEIKEKLLDYPAVLNICFGLIIDETKDIWPIDYYYGIINEENKIIKND